jgi:hypothetical protein
MTIIRSWSEIICRTGGAIWAGTPHLYYTRKQVSLPRLKFKSQGLYIATENFATRLTGIAFFCHPWSLVFIRDHISMAKLCEEATKVVRKRLEVFERSSCTGFGKLVFTKSRLVNLECRGFEVDSKTGEYVAAKGASVTIEHEVDIDSSKL